ncbi:MAG: tRNA (guanosine(37)-N1)-methyltransferase TrmD [Candidatus Marinimicrobia bacterium]|nr:tRNA (guanosine(37)-N1)-methyltransferase TrmD [Candidatus Neomarinimicrobiota bacterium]|tara:strand:- start:4662 stop:5360 length:699 start_codon:yes stop_codon:yes gene_type:complete
MDIHLISPFDKIAKVALSESILNRANKNGYVNYYFYNLYKYADFPHQKIDDSPFGGGFGMILKPEPIFRIIDEIESKYKKQQKYRIVFPTPDGRILNQKISNELSKEEQLIFISGHYKGLDQRVRDELVTDEVSIGDYVLTGGDLPSLVIIDTIVRLIPGVIGKIESAKTDSFSNPLLDYPHYTRPESYRGLKVPDVLTSGHHENIDKWRQKKRLEKTKNRRPDLLEKFKNN